MNGNYIKSLSIIFPFFNEDKRILKIIKKIKFLIYKFKNFEGSLNFINQASKIAEDENHHPDLKFGWGYANIIIFTHAVKGLTESDFVLAAKIDQLSA